MATYLMRLAKQLAWLPLCLVAWVFPRDQRLWVFGAWHGRQYADNARYLYRHVRDREPTLRAVWLAHDPAVVRQVAKEGGEAELAYSWRGILVALRAGVFLVTHSSEDVNTHASLGGRLINLTHGTPLKRMGKDARALRNDAVTLLFERYLRRLLPGKRRAEMLLVASEEGQQRMISAFELPFERVVPLGYPRWDAFAEGGGDLLRRQGIDPDAYAGILLYAPTLRLRGRGELDLAQGERLERLLPWLASERLLLLIRGHTSLKMTGVQALLASGSPWLREAPVSMFPDVNALLPAVDGLITDYSSLMYDYACLNRPIILMAPDLDDYLNADVGIYGDYLSDAPGPVIDHWQQLPDAWRAIHRGEHQARLSAFVTRHAGLHDGRACARATAVVKALLAGREPRCSMS
jgi:CDP-glycerol glycerophosphotransferase (TagB/SpsB family)